MSKTQYMRSLNRPSTVSAILIMLPILLMSQDSLFINGHLAISERLKLSDVDTDNATRTIRWDQTIADFEGFNGAEWLSLTETNSENDLDGAIYGLGSFSGYTPATSSDGTSGDMFGKCVAMSGAYAITGAPAQETNGSFSGAAYIFYRDGSGWSEPAKLLPMDGAAGDTFGLQVAIEGDYAIIGAPGNDDAGAASGSAYVFARSGAVWVQQAKLVASDAAAGDLFGYDVDIWGSFVIVGARGNDDAGASSGSAYIFGRNGTSWTQLIKLTASNAIAGDQFGKFVGIHEHDAFVIAENPDNPIDTAAAYIFVYNGMTWTEQDYVEDWGFQTADIQDDNLVIGSIGIDTTFIMEDPAVYIYHRTSSTWALHKTFVLEDNNEHAFDVSISGDQVLAGVYKDQPVIGCDMTSVSNGGKALLFRKTGGVWYQHLSLADPFAAINDHYSFGVAISDDRVLIGVPDANTNGKTDQGKVIFGKID